MEDIKYSEQIEPYKIPKQFFFYIFIAYLFSVAICIYVIATAPADHLLIKPVIVSSFMAGLTAFFIAFLVLMVKIDKKLYKRLEQLPSDGGK